MGVTLPLLVGARRDTARLTGVAGSESFGGALGALYGWNTMGAVAGALASDAILVQALGVRGTGGVAGALDQTSEGQLRARLPAAGDGDLEFDLARCTFISSAGLRLILDAHKTTASRGKQFQLVNVPPAIEKVLETTGLAQLVRYNIARREINVEGMELLSAGACGECYRLDGESVVKLYFPGIAGEMVEREKKFAREAFILGVPTAISYEIVQCQGRLGVIYVAEDDGVLVGGASLDPVSFGRIANYQTAAAPAG